MCKLVVHTAQVRAGTEALALWAHLIASCAKIEVAMLNQDDSSLSFEIRKLMKVVNVATAIGFLVISCKKEFASSSLRLNVVKGQGNEVKVKSGLWRRLASKHHSGRTHAAGMASSWDCRAAQRRQRRAEGMREP